MWTARTEQLSEVRGFRIAVERDDSPVPYAEVLRGWRRDAEFRAWFIALLAGAPYSAFRWETPPITTATVGRPFEFVLLDSPGLAGRPAPHAFAAHFPGPAAGNSVVAFPNLGRDALLVVPRPQAPPSAYGHLASFLRHSPEAQRHALWEVVGEAVERRLGAAPVWVNTAGAGVWLHVRLDDRPKYYAYTPYRTP